MRKIVVKLKKITVNNFSPKEKTVEIDIHFNDGADKEITKKIIGIDDPRKLAEELILEIRNLEKSSHQKFDGESILDTIVNIVFDDEDKILSKLSMFFSKLCEKIDSVRTTTDASGYIDLINKVNSMKFDL